MRSPVQGFPKHFTAERHVQLLIHSHLNWQPITNCSVDNNLCIILSFIQKLKQWVGAGKVTVRVRVAVSGKLFVKSHSH